LASWSIGPASGYSDAGTGRFEWVTRVTY